MSRTTNARIAGTTFLVYIAAGITAMRLFARATDGKEIAAKLAAVAAHAATMRVVLALDVVQVFCALVLAVTLYALTRDQDPDLAMLGLACRLSEGVIAALSIPGGVSLLAVATAVGAGAPDSGARALGAYLMDTDMTIPATFFAVGSTVFAYLLLRGRMIPAPLAWLGVAASILLVVCLPLQLAGLLHAPFTSFMYLPMLAFEAPAGFWLIVKGVSAPHDFSAAAADRR